MKKTLEQRLIEQAEQMEKSAEAIRQIVAKSKDAGIVWPEIDEETGTIEGTEVIDGKRYRTVEATKGCVGCVFLYDEKLCDKPSTKCYGHQRLDRRSVIFKNL